MVDTPDPNIQLIDPRPSAPDASYGGGQSVQTDIRAARLEVIATADDQVNLAEPPTPTNPQNPYNKVYQSLSGHISEWDDTPGGERILEQHKSGTFYEIHPDGSRVTKIFGKDFYLVLDDHTLFVGGNLNISAQGDVNLLVAGDCTQKVDGDYNLTVNGDMTTRVAGKTIHYGKGDVDIQSNTAINMWSNGTIHQQSVGSWQVNANATYIVSATTGEYSSTGKTYLTSSQMYLNDPAAPSAPDGVLKSLDPTSGLTVPDSLIQPSLESQFAIRTDNNALVSTIDTTTKYPKDRVKNNN